MRHIMVIDDSITIRSSVEMVLKNPDFIIKHAQNGADALEKINEIKKTGGEIAICITDVNMPVMDGITFVNEFRKFDKFTPVLMLTTESEESKIKEGKNAGASGWLVKPFQSEQLSGAVAKLIK
jgi:two-component system, chemotaxis family, chemotaxis protein CheY